MRRALLILCTGAMLAGVAVAQQEAVTEAAVPVAAPVVATSPEQTLAQLTELKANNAKTLEQQAAMLKRLAELEKQAEQLRIFSKRG